MPATRHAVAFPADHADDRTFSIILAAPADFMGKVAEVCCAIIVRVARAMTILALAFALDARS